MAYLQLGLFTAVEGLPLRLVFEQTDGLDMLGAVSQSEPVVNARRQHQQVLGVQLGADPPVVLIANIKVAFAFNDVTDLLVLVVVLLVELLHLGVVSVQVATKAVQVEGNLVAILVVTLFGNGVQLVNGGAMAVENADALKLSMRNLFARVVALSEVLRSVVVVVVVEFNHVGDHNVGLMVRYRNRAGTTCGKKIVVLQPQLNPGQNQGFTVRLSLVIVICSLLFSGRLRYQLLSTFHLDTADAGDIGLSRSWGVDKKRKPLRESSAQSGQVKAISC